MGNIYIQVGKDNIVQRIHKSPFDPTYGLHTTKADLEKTGFFVEDIPEPVMVEGKRAIAKYNPDSKQIYYEYENIPLTANERMDLIEAAFNEILFSETED